MAKRKSNRAARRLFAHRTKISNRRRASNYHRFTMWDDSWTWQVNEVETFKRSRRQRCNEKRRFEWLREHASTDCDYSGIADHNPQFHH